MGLSEGIFTNVVDHLLRHGIPFRTADVCRRAAPLSRQRLPFSPTLPVRIHPVSFDARDFFAWEAMVRLFMKLPRARAAFLVGGLIWRVAMEYTSPDTRRAMLVTVKDGPLRANMDARVEFARDESFGYDDDTLSSAEKRLMCGTYIVYRGWCDCLSRFSATYGWFARHRTRTLLLVSKSE